MFAFLASQFRALKLLTRWTSSFLSRFSQLDQRSYRRTLSVKTFAIPFLIGFGLSVAVSACAAGGSTNLPDSASVSHANTSQNNQSNAVRIGYQKYGTLFLLKARGNLDQQLKSQGVAVQWIQFPAGPQMLEALNAGSLDYGSTGETPPIFAEAAGAPLVYIGNEVPDPEGEAILVPKNSPIQKVAELKGKKVALNKGSNVHYLLVQALTAAGLQYSDIHPVYLPPADARAAFDQGNVDAWVIWEPYLTVAKRAVGARVLQDGRGLTANRQFYLAAKSFAAQHPDRVKAIVEEIQLVDSWTKAHLQEAATLLSPQIGIDVPTLTEALRGRSYQFEPIRLETVAYQQKIADTFFKLGLIPKPVNVKADVQTVAQAPTAQATHSHQGQ
ncbi:MAG: sulfonate ABC transporter substrate-binding protein [Chroococcidiopsidaceae cyanobacterium CP_BM_ER_R8_30]|nr:sulfonate ABC transporter substrate-binding protein [Chroococcidiopsidaceae cyanobacterium CP_BM_ER_R8_30]